MSAYHDGQDAARAGKAFQDNPHAKPAKPEAGANYPGDWAHWASGWLMVKDATGRNVKAERQELHAQIMAGIYA